jgi:alkaline phosphatase
MKRIPGTIVLVAVLAALAHAAMAQTSTLATVRPAAQNVIVFIGNGLGPATTTAARLMRYKEDGALAMESMPALARVRTWALDAQTSESAAATSMLLTGTKTRNDVVAMDGDTRSQGYAPGRDPIRNVPAAENRCPATGNGQAVATLLELAVAKHRSTGIVTTGRLTGGPSAAAWAHVCHRDAEYEVARQAVPKGAGFNARLGNGVDVMMGGGSAYWRPFDAAKRARGRPDIRELVGEMQAQGYTFVGDLTALNAAPVVAGSRLLGLFDQNDADGTQQGALSYELDRDPKREPSLAEMTAKAMDVLGTNADGYVLVVEAGRIVQAVHAGNARRALVDTIAFDDAVRVALDKADIAHTLIVVTGDHDTTMTLIGGSRRGSDVLGLHLDPASGKPDVDASGSTYTSIVFGTGPNRPDQRKSLDTPTVVQKDYVQESVVKLASGTNGGGDVVLRAAGAGSSNFHGTLDNIKVFALIRKIADL